MNILKNLLLTKTGKWATKNNASIQALINFNLSILLIKKHETPSHFSRYQQQEYQQCIG
jgi:hypothetical protein